jgi:hypothetical protein
MNTDEHRFLPQPATECQVRIDNLRFSRSLELGKSEAFISGFVKPNLPGRVHHFAVTAHHDAVERLWGFDLKSFRWTSPVPRSLFDLRNTDSVCKALAGGLRLLWMQPVPGNNESGAQIRIGQTFISDEQIRDSFSILRGDILSLYRLDWPKLWPAIENRLMNDPEFWISGFTRQDAVDAVATLKTVFPWEWVRRRYRDVAKKRLEVGMWDVMQADQGFPAYVLARTAIGCICKDPGWNYLIGLAESCKLLKAFPKGNSLLQRIAAHEPGHIHQANFSGYLLRRGLLAEVEPATGSGSAKHDMAARVGDIVFDIEMKALITTDPARQVKGEIEEKCRKLPSVLSRPVVFFVLLVETSVTGERESSPDRLNSIASDVFGQTSGVSAVVVGRMFVDSNGGPVKWSFDKFLLNTQAHRQVDEPSLRLVFKPNWQRLTYPLMPIVFSYNLTDKAQNKTNEVKT